MRVEVLVSGSSTHTKAGLVSYHDDHVLGPDTAAITLVSYCDFECPYCGRAYSVIKRLQASLTDHLRFIFRHFPLIHKHPFAQQASEAAEAAAAQGQFWAMHDLLFENQVALREDDLASYVGMLGLDTARFKDELSRKLYATRMGRDVRLGRQSGVTGTPTFFINGSRHTDENSLKRLVLSVSQRRPA
jgi:protein-disulfide isomerase